MNEPEEKQYITHGTKTCPVCDTKFLRVDGKCPKCFPPTTDLFGNPLENK